MTTLINIPISSTVPPNVTSTLPRESFPRELTFSGLPADSLNNNENNASLRSLSSGYESLIMEASRKPHVTLDLTSGNAIASHPKLQDNDLLKPVVPPFHLPPGFESPADDIFTRPFGSQNNNNNNDDVSVFLSHGVIDTGVGARALSGTATSPMPPGRTSRPVAKLFASHQTHHSPSSTILNLSGGGGTPSPHSSGGASSVSAVLRLPHSHSGGAIHVRSGSAQNSSLLMSSGTWKEAE